jgi:hypothetical protein
VWREVGSLERTRRTAEVAGESMIMIHAQLSANKRSSPRRRHGKALKMLRIALLEGFLTAGEKGPAIQSIWIHDSPASDVVQSWEK